MAERPEDERRPAQGEADSFTGGPGVVVTKSQGRGAVLGVSIGAVVGGLLGLLLGVVIDSVLVGVIVGLVAGSVVGGVAFGGQNPKQKLGEGSEADV